MAANQYPETATPSPILSIDHGVSHDYDPAFGEMHSHEEPKLLWSSTATVLGRTATRDLLIPPGYGVWIPGGVEHGGEVLRDGEGSALTFDPDRCPITWTEPTGVLITPLLRELILHLGDDAAAAPSRPYAEALMFELLVPLDTRDLHAPMPHDPRARAVAERLVVDPADPRDLPDWADEVHAGTRTLARLFVAETGLSFARWRTQIRMRTAVQVLADGSSVDSAARAVGYRKTSAFIAAFRRATGQTPGTYIG